MELLNPLVLSLTHGTLIPDALASYSGLSSDAKLLWCVMNRISESRTTYAYFERSFVARRLGLSPARACKALGELVKHGLLVRHERSNYYHFAKHEALYETRQDASIPPEEDETEPWDGEDPEKFPFPYPPTMAQLAQIWRAC